MNACLIWAWQVFWVKRYKKPLFIYSTGVGPLKTWWGKIITRWLYKQADIITVRDHFSRDLLHQIGVLDKNIYTTADPAFLYKKQELSRERTRNTIIISLRPWLKYGPKIVNVFTAFLEDLKEKKDTEFIFTCMQQIREHDHQVIDPILKKVGGELYIPKHFSDLIHIMQTAEFAIGMRYHFLIASFKHIHGYCLAF